MTEGETSWTCLQFTWKSSNGLFLRQKMRCSVLQHHQDCREREHGIEIEVGHRMMKECTLAMMLQHIKLFRPCIQTADSHQA